MFRISLSLRDCCCSGLPPLCCCCPAAVAGTTARLRSASSSISITSLYGRESIAATGFNKDCCGGLPINWLMGFTEIAGFGGDVSFGVAAAGTIASRSRLVSSSNSSF
uniref:(northern house mosquito) hypothetical protein n=1 Tax=Culex pipiens TaxID=7175 RepID=A0A8D8JC97_CULPI